MADFVSGVGPLFGPDFVIVTVNDATGTQYDVQVYPDAAIAALQQTHLERLVEAVSVSDLGLDDTGSFIAQESPELVDTEGGDQPVTQTAFDDIAA